MRANARESGCMGGEGGEQGVLVDRTALLICILSKETTVSSVTAQMALWRRGREEREARGGKCKET